MEQRRSKPYLRNEHELLTVVIPAFNESKAIGDTLKSLSNICQGLIAEIIVVDDGSTDDTAQIAEGAGVRVIRHHRNQGYGASLKSGIRAAKTDYVLTMDSDGQHNPEDIARLWEAAAQYDMVVGERAALLHSQLWRMPGKWLLSLMANYLSRQRIPDLNSGFRLMKRDVAMKYMHLCPSGFSFSTTITMVFFNRGYDVGYVPIQVNKRVGQSTVSINTGLETIILILRIATLFDPLRVFIPMSLFIGAVGVLWGVPYTLTGHGISVGAMLAIVTAMLMFSLGLICDQISQLRLERYE